MLCRFQPEGKILFVNEAYAEARGSTPGDLVGQNFWDFIPRADHAGVRTTLESLTPQSPVVTIENRIETVEGVRWTLWTNRALRFSKKGRVTEAQSSGVDITDRKLAEEALRQSEERFRGVVEAAPNGIILVDTEGRIVMANPEAERALGYEPGELDLQPVEVLVPERLRDGHYAWRDAFLADPATRPMGAGRDLYARRKDGSEFPVEIGLSPLATPQGRRVLATIVDITERKRAEEEMRAASALKDQFLGLVSHELRTPIATVSGNSTLLLRRGDLLTDDDRRQALEDIANEAGRLQSIIENLLILSRIDGSNALHFEPVALDKLALNRVRSFTRRAPTRRIDLNATDSSVVEGEANLLAMVIDNLIANADKYSPRGEPIELALCNGGATVEVAVRDHGIGLDENELQELFEPFYRGSSGRDLAKGMGLGLATCKRIIEAHGGSIRASTHPDGGAEFTFVLPVVKAGPAGEEENVAAS
jgi:PAS domain S-box-containing protein